MHAVTLLSAHRDDDAAGQVIVDAIGCGGFVAPRDLIRRPFEIRPLQQHGNLLRPFLPDRRFLDHRLTIRQTYGAAVTHDLDLSRVRGAGEVENCGQRAGVGEADEAVKRVRDDELPG